MTNPMDLFGQLIRCPLSDFGSWFSGFQQTAFRLECLPAYDVEQERDYIAQFKTNAPCPDDFNSDWIAIQLDAKNKNKQMRRVRMLPCEGCDHSYFNFEKEWGYKRSAQAGEIIHFIDSFELDKHKYVVPILKDFWLFDDCACFLMEYDLIGRFLGVHQVPSNHINNYVKLSNILIDSSIPAQL